MFKGIKNNWKKAEAASIVQTLLERQIQLGLLDADASSVATALVKKAWEVRPDWFDGRHGAYPHKAAAAAIVLAMGVETLPKTGRLHGPVMGCLIQMMMDLEAEGHLLPLTAVDHRMLTFARERLMEAHERLAKSDLGDEFQAMMSSAEDRQGQV